MKKVSLATDGSCLNNPGPGGWACLLRFGGKKREIFGFDPHTTNNRMELMATIRGLLALKEPCEVEITTDSEYVFLGMTERIPEWKRRNWRLEHGPLRHADLWIELDELASLHKSTWRRTPGHADNEDNVRCDWLARKAAATQKSSWENGRPHAPSPSQPGCGLRAAQTPSRAFSMTQSPMEMTRTVFNDNAEVLGYAVTTLSWSAGLLFLENYAELIKTFTETKGAIKVFLRGGPTFLTAPRSDRNAK